MWAQLAGAAVGGLLSRNKGGGQTTSKEPWAPAQDWLRQNIATGQNLQNHYQQNPFGALQQGAYANLLGQGDAFNQMVPGLLAQFSQHQGFDRSNPRARPQAYQFGLMPQTTQMRGLLGAAPQQGPAPLMNSGPANPYMAPSFAPPTAAPAASPPVPPSLYAYLTDGGS